jgi:hypothetical protein
MNSLVRHRLWGSEVRAGAGRGGYVVAFVMSVIAGVAALLWPFDSIATHMLTAGILLGVIGITQIVRAFPPRKATRRLLCAHRHPSPDTVGVPQLSRKLTKLGRWTQKFATALGLAAVAALVVIGAVNSGGSPSVILARSGGSGDSATTTNYLEPTVPAISTSATLSSGVTVTSSSPASAPATPSATPTVTPSSSTPCSNNGVVLPGGCH